MRKIKNFVGNWIEFWWGWNFSLTYEVCGYFDNRPRINIALVFFHLTLIFPFRNKWENECDPPEWGIKIHNNAFWIYKGGKGNMKGGNKTVSFYVPWDFDWVRTSTLLKSGHIIF